MLPYSLFLILMTIITSILFYLLLQLHLLNLTLLHLVHHLQLHLLCLPLLHLLSDTLGMIFVLQANGGR